MTPFVSYDISGLFALLMKIKKIHLNEVLWIRILADPLVKWANCRFSHQNQTLSKSFFSS